MKTLSYRSEKSAHAISAFWGKPLDKPDWYAIKSLSEDQTEVMIYDIIGYPWNDAGELVRALAGITSKEILVRISSPGGDIFDSLSIFNALSSHKSKIITRNEALAASAASILMLAGKERQAYKSSMAMIHEPWAVMIGNQHEVREMADVLGKITDNMIDIYAGNTNIGKREWKEMMAKGETWWNAKEMKENGFINTILDGKPVKAEFDLSIFANLPEEFKEDKELTERDAEKILRDAGFSRHKAKAVLARRKEAEGDEPVVPIVTPIIPPQDDSELIAALKNNLKLFGGN